MDSTAIGRALLVVALLVAVVGVYLALGGKLPFGQLPGDITIRTSNATISIPIVTCILLSVVLTVVLAVVFRR